jgi:hypothetical protein
MLTSSVGSPALRRVEVNAPTFLPYLLSQEPGNPGELIRLALKERESRTVRSYREWRRELLADLADGRVRTKTRKDLRIIADEIQRRTKGDAAVSLHLSYAADWTALVGALTGWERLPGTRWDCSPGSTPAPPWMTARCDSGSPRSFPGVGSVGS